MTLTRRGGFFIAFMLALTVLFVLLGRWQLDRLAWKQALIAAVETRAHNEPVPLPPAAVWPALLPDDYDFTAVRFTASYTADPPVWAFTALAEPNGPLGGPGEWMMQLVALPGGGRVWLNRGFVPEDRLSDAAPGAGGPFVFEGLMRRPEAANAFTPAPQPDDRRDFVRDPTRFPPPAGFAEAVVAPFTVDLSQSEAALPQAGETVMNFPNRHLEYALTWFALAVLTPVLLAVWLWRQRHEPGSLAPPGGGD